MKHFAIILFALFVFQSCSVLRPNQVPDYTDGEQTTEQLITHQPIPMPGDSTRNVIVYNVVEGEERGISDETLRSLISQFFGTVSTIFALIYGTNTTP